MTNLQLDNLSIHLIGGSNYSAPDDCCVYLIYDHDDTNFSILVDAGAGSSQSISKIIQNIESLTRLEQLQFILVTHVHIDHIGGLKEIKSYLPQAKIITHTYAAEKWNR